MTNKQPEKEPYHMHDHYHCWQDKNPACGQKIKHFECCLCKKEHPEIEAERQRCDEMVGVQFVNGYCKIGDKIYKQVEGEWQALTQPTTPLTSLAGTTSAPDVTIEMTEVSTPLTNDKE